MCPYRHILFLIVYFHRSYPAGVLRILVVVGSTPTEVERRDTNHLVIGQCEIKDADILYHPLFVPAKSQNRAQFNSSVDGMTTDYPKTLHIRYMKNGMSDTPCTCALKPLIFEFSDSAEAFV